VRRRAGWLPEDQDELESWLAGHRKRTEGRGEQVELHPVLTEFQSRVYSYGLPAADAGSQQDRLQTA
jgi:phosphatidylserine decarboxylase